METNVLHADIRDCNTLPAACIYTVMKLCATVKAESRKFGGRMWNFIIIPFFCDSIALVALGLLIFEASRSHSDKPHTR
jgi:hypothetical protein